jgi:hypothetical protein
MPGHSSTTGSAATLWGPAGRGIAAPMSTTHAMAGAHVWRFGGKFLQEHAERVLTTNGRRKNEPAC